MSLLFFLSLILTVFQEHELKIEILQKGSGYELVNGDTITVHYSGIVFGEKKPFENSKHNQPITFVVGKEDVIQGWDLGLIGVQKDETRRLTIPPSLAYGNNESDVIPANSTLIFDIEVLDIRKGPRRLEIPDDVKRIIREKVEIFDIKIGINSEVTKASKVTYHYRLFNKNDVLLFSSYSFEPETMKMNTDSHLIKGFQNGLYGMKVGGIRVLICEGPFNTPEDTFIYEVEILSITNNP